MDEMGMETEEGGEDREWGLRQKRSRTREKKS
jgi:hypothetical protein